MSQPSPVTFSRSDWLWFAAIWVIAAAMLVLRMLYAQDQAPLFGDTDDAMRMVVVRDFLAGQNWYDTIQHRLNTPYGGEIHWSRLVDLPLAVLLWLATALAGPQTALAFTGIVWPLLLLALLLFLSARITLELVGREGLLPALVLPIVSPAILAEFNPGRVDHHNVVILLTLACLWATLVALRRPLAAWLAGMLAATALAIAVEALPLVVAAILAFGLAYILDPVRAANLRRFGLGFAGAMLVHLALARPPVRWLEAACDMISPVYVLAALAVGGAYLLVSLLPAPRNALHRLLLLALLGSAAAALVALSYPQCLAGPYGELDPWLRQNWLAAIVEAKPWHVSLREMPVYAIVVGVPVLLAFVAIGFAIRRQPRASLPWLLLLIFLGAAALVMLAQVRGARLAILPAIPAAAWLIVAARRAYLRRPTFGPALALIGSWLAFSGVILGLLVGLVLAILPTGNAALAAEKQGEIGLCRLSESFATLRDLPPQRVMTPIDLGSHLLLETAHSTVAAPYHRVEAGVIDAFRFFNRPATEAFAIAQARGLTLLVLCQALPELQGASARADGTVIGLLAAGTPPPWLTRLAGPGPLELYAIDLSAQP